MASAVSAESDAGNVPVMELLPKNLQSPTGRCARDGACGFVRGSVRLAACVVHVWMDTPHTGACARVCERGSEQTRAHRKFSAVSAESDAGNVPLMAFI